ncbi:MAG: hypothetical protein GF401_02305 [Chitinivibrionales bacterium]|nr:hypothetical protein [Chitinivibrionales bacterium]
MPQRDGTGPLGSGPGTGRRRGWCKRFFFPRGSFSMRRAGIVSTLIPVAGALIRDAMNPNGLVQTFRKKLFHRKNARNKAAVEADYTVVSENKS